MRCSGSDSYYIMRWNETSLYNYVIKRWLAAMIYVFGCLFVFLIELWFYLLEILRLFLKLIRLSSRQNQEGSTLS